MKKILPIVISEYQSSFIPNRMIHDNVIVAFETIHCLKRMGKRGRKKLALKLDMAKAYDCVKWAYLERKLLKMEFPIKFVNLVMKCVTSVSYSFLLNGRPRGEVAPSQGIRQGDPISPYLFLIVSEGFSSLLQKAEENSLIHDISTAVEASSINHLFFADDSLLFCDVIPSEVGESRFIKAL